MPTDLINRRILRRIEVASLTGLSPATLYRLISRGAFPRPVQLSERATGWRTDEIEVAGLPPTHRSRKPRASEGGASMSCTTVRSHTRNGHQVRSHTRRTNGSAVAEVLMRDMYRAYERLDGENVGPVGGDPACPHPSWYPVRHVDGTRILAYACTDCARTKPADEVRERVPLGTGG